MATNKAMSEDEIKFRTLVPHVKHFDYNGKPAVKEFSIYMMMRAVGMKINDTVWQTCRKWLKDLGYSDKKTHKISAKKEVKFFIKLKSCVLLFLAMLMASPSYADVYEDFFKSLNCGEKICPEYESIPCVECLNGVKTDCEGKVATDCEKKVANEKKDQKNKLKQCILDGKDKLKQCVLDGFKKCKKAVDEALADSGGVENIPGIKNLFALGDSTTALEKEMKGVENNPDMMKAQKEKQIQFLKQKGSKLTNEISKVMQKQILNAPITLKGIYVHDFNEQIICIYEGRWSNSSSMSGECGDGGQPATINYIIHDEKTRDIYQPNRGKIRVGDPNGVYEYRIGRYEKSAFIAKIISSKEFKQNANRGIYDITGTIVNISPLKDAAYGYDHDYDQVLLTIELKSAKYIGKKEK